MQPLVVLLLLPLLIGVVARLACRDTTRATILAVLVSPIAIYLCIEVLDPGGTWNALATLLVAPLAVAFSLGVIVSSIGRSGHGRRRRASDG